MTIKVCTGIGEILLLQYFCFLILTISKPLNKLKAPFMKYFKLFLITLLLTLSGCATHRVSNFKKAFTKTTPVNPIDQNVQMNLTFSTPHTGFLKH
jgi:hypothetical protein